MRFELPVQRLTQPHSEDRGAVRRAGLIILCLVVLRLVVAATTPLTFDEAYYWTWSKTLAGGYYDHPPMVAVMIRLGTLLAGDTEFGVRLVGVLLALPTSWAVYRSGAILFGSARVGATAAILFNTTMMAWLGTIMATPDVPLMLASSLVLWSLAKLIQTGRGAWWLAVGAAVGAALLSKYNALFLGPTLLIWMIAVADLRRWLRSPWPYLGGLVALLLFSPTLIWNAQHEWASFLKQFGRVGADEFRPRYLLGLLAGQFVVMTPAVAILGFSGLLALARGLPGLRGAATLLHATIWVVVAYFAVHALHEEVHPDWLCQIYPALAIAAAVAVERTEWRPRWQRFVDFLGRWAVPGSVAMVALIVLQLHSGVLSGYRNEEGVRLVGVGFPEVARQIEQLRVRLGASCILATDYGTTSWLMFYLPPGSCVAQHFERIRWANAKEPDAAQLNGKLLFVGRDSYQHWLHPWLVQAFASVDRVADVSRMRGPTVIETYRVDLLDGARGDILLRWPPPELIRRRGL
ncbi:4-amino-4-deoxy-L-arabinose transferase-like glycosyltransferase [Rhodopseudomonas rhenobacensis]|uniref:4-amino-4-deoxy-L-arabinose transferase-like glycosyltransferase n=1 Tax=Rhodopseudomonas rhenobacensis TaxID=87461 RepID=A0A7W8DZZ2_9BRAD|nr:4-amino-4-deoxy-L-arabinose transferase-like glycosyltransferase [Rhodopseudomonas rhenobacensis]